MSKLSALVEILAAKPVLWRKDLATRYGVTLSTIDRWHTSGTLPPARYLRGCPHPLWRACDVEQSELSNKILLRAKGKTNGDQGKK
jgi:hypothetical protein